MKPLRALIAEHRGAAIILAVFVILATAYNLANPLFEAPDERLHYRYIHYLQHERTLPVVELNGPLTEDHQAPLYYVVAAVLTPPISQQQFDELAHVNPFWGYRIGDVGDDNKNQYLHGPSEEFPYESAVWSLRAVRFLSTLFGIGTVILTYWLASRFVSKPLAAASMAVVAFTPNFLLTSSAITNDSLVIVATTAAGLIILDLLAQDDKPSLREWMLLSLFFGLGVLSKVSFLPLLPLLALAVGLLAWRLRSWRVFFVAGSVLLGGVALVSGWWVLRNLRLYGDMTGLRRMWEVWGIRAPLTWADSWIELHNFRTTFWANFGYGNIPMPNWVYWLTDAFALGTIVGLLIAGVRSVRSGNSVPLGRRAQIAFLILWSLVTLAALIWYLQRTISVTGRQLYAVLPVIALGLVAGWAALVPDKWHRVLASLIGALMLALAVGALVCVLMPAYAPAPRLAVESADTAMTHRLDWQLGNTIMLRGYDLSPEAINPGEDAILTLYWQPVAAPERNYTVFAHLFGQNNAQVGARDTYPGLGDDPTRYWQPGEVIVDRIPILVSPDAEGPVLLDVEVGLYDLESGERLPIYDSAGNEVGYPVVGTIKLSDQTPVSSQFTCPEEWEFAGGTCLREITVSLMTPRPGDDLDVILDWAPAGPLPASYTVFIHLVNNEGSIVAQSDSVPLNSRYPTTAWAAGEQFEDAHVLRLPADLLPGEYHLLMGLYDPQTGTRLSLSGGLDHIELDRVIEVQ